MCKYNTHDIANKVDVQNLLKLVDIGLKANDTKSRESNMLEQQPKQCTYMYRLFKYSKGVELYVKMSISMSQHSLEAQLRSSVFTLNIQAGSYSTTK